MNKTLKITSTAMLTALAVVANLFTIPLTPTKSIVLSFTMIPIFVAGIYFGIIPAMIVGFLGDLIAHFVNPWGAYNWFVGLSCLLLGLIPALLYKTKLPNFAKLLLSVVICFVACTCFLNTFGLWLQIIVGVDPSPIGIWQWLTEGREISKSFWVYLLGRIPLQLLGIAINTIILATIQQTKVLDKALQKWQLPTSTNNGD